LHRTKKSDSWEKNLSERFPITETGRTLPDSEIFHKRFFRKIINNVYGLSVAAKNGFL